MNEPATRVLHADAGIEDSPDIAPPLHLSTTYARDADGEAGSHVYRRDHHLTSERLEKVLGELEGGTALVYPSGMGAIAAVLRSLNPARVCLPDDVYHGTRHLVTVETELGRWEQTDLYELEPGDVWWVESPSNPKCLITDIAATVAAARDRGVKVVVDSTFATPILQQPLQLGADAVVHATTKFINGHSDAMGGMAVTNDDTLVERMRSLRVADGSLMGNLEAWLTLRGVRTLPLRVERQSSSAEAIADVLVRDPRVTKVWYPGLADHPLHDVAASQMSGYGGMLSFEVDSFEAANAVLARLKLFRVATSLGGVESLAEHRRRVDDHAPEGLIRLSVGLESPTDLFADLDRALGTQDGGQEKKGAIRSPR
ncbi:MAG: PLP-dependent transferase [Actinomycetia bacterium]|nr:PLP-dependent transferase [Actinomycetes bacterium]MCP4084806.1 PLP-dependent transferase [Actinomycetes bacterium]